MRIIRPPHPLYFAERLTAHFGGAKSIASATIEITPASQDHTARHILLPPHGKTRITRYRRGAELRRRATVAARFGPALRRL